MSYEITREGRTDLVLVEQTKSSVRFEVWYDREEQQVKHSDQKIVLFRDEVDKFIDHYKR